MVLAREGHAWGVFQPIQQMRFESGRGTRPPVMGLGFAAYWALSIAAVGGVMILRRRHVPVYPLLAPILTAAIGVALTFGSVRYRTPADVSIVLLAAVAIARASAPAPRRRIADGVVNAVFAPRSRADCRAAGADGGTAAAAFSCEIFAISSSVSAPNTSAKTACVSGQVPSPCG